ncbi:fimbria/pilus periplasmic chaperone [Polaromonas sp.]|uniref:fimbrial biogenesis chaperone n=1 Tax=Polaromonas sp. TaxID=1869339 RepID=UPI00286C7A0C|nr:fimbria/pilus periplasmic chaperone [Polaromonas sp.]
MTKSFRIDALVALCWALFASGPVLAGEFSVNPIRLELGASVRSSVIGVKNEDKQKLSFQLQAMEWTQDAAGKDQYAETQDLVFFPKILSIEPGEEGLIRVGAKTAVVAAEKTYRLFIEELPGTTRAPQGSGAQINVLIRFGAPIFVTPPKPRDSLDIESFILTKGVVTIAARNTGNRHQLVQGINLKGTDSAGNEVYALTLADRYLLAGSARSYTTPISAAQCAKVSSLALEFQTDKLSATRKLDVTRTMCP